MREVRLGLVCYGGVSLAIYLHGVTKELSSAPTTRLAARYRPTRTRASG
jgi:hypothetical protein